MRRTSFLVDARRGFTKAVRPSPARKMTVFLLRAALKWRPVMVRTPPTLMRIGWTRVICGAGPFLGAAAAAAGSTRRAAATSVRQVVTMRRIALSLSALWVVIGVLEAIAGHDYEVGQDRGHEAAVRSDGRAGLRTLGAALGGRAHLHLADLVDLDGVGVAVLLGEDVLGPGPDVRERALGFAGLAAALAGGLERRVDEEDRVGALRRDAHEDQERRGVARQHVELLHALDVPGAAVRLEGQVDDVLVDGRRGVAAASAGGGHATAAGRRHAATADRSAVAGVAAGGGRPAGRARAVAGASRAGR